MTAKTYYAFLQARDPITVNSPPEEVQDSHRNIARWHFITAGTASTNDKQGRLKALRNLRNIVDSQGSAMLAWEDWEGSELLNYDG
jgi:hypothetical protein